MFDFTQKYVLENERVKLRPLTMDDHKALVNIANDAEIWYYLFDQADTSASLLQYLSHAITGRNRLKSYPFTVYDKVKKQVAGLTRLYEYNEEFKTIKLGHTWYGKDFRGTYLNTNCKYLIFQFIFDNLGLERIGFGVHSENIRSLKALRKLGCKDEGKLESFMPGVNNTNRVDIVLLRVLKDEWKQEVKSKLLAKLN